MRYATGCKCGRSLCLVDEPQHCIRCGRGPFPMPRVRLAERRRQLPWDLGAFVREGRRPDPNLENVVRFDRLRPGPRAVLIEIPDVADDVRLSPQQERILALAAEGLTNGQIANALGMTKTTVSSTLSHTYRRIGLEQGRPGPGAPSRAAAIAWWQSRRRDSLDEAA